MGVGVGVDVYGFVVCLGGVIYMCVWVCVCVAAIMSDCM